MRRTYHLRTVRRAVGALAASAVVLGTGVAACATPAKADPIVVYTNPLDVHVPNIRAAWCPGGRGGFFVYWCDGRPYPDGTQYHYDTATGLRCVVRTGEMNPPDAPPGGCGGTW